MKAKLGDLPLGSGMLKKAARKIKKNKKRTQSRLDQIMGQMTSSKKKSK